MMAANSEAHSLLPAKRRWTFGLRSFLLVLFVLSLAFIHVGNERRRQARQREIVAQLQSKKWYVQLSPPQESAPMRAVLGGDAYRYVDFVRRRGSPPGDDESLSLLAELPKVRAVDFANWVDDDTVQDLLNMRGLERATLSDHKISPAGFERLATHPTLRSLELLGSGTTDESLSALSTARQLRYLRVERGVTGNAFRDFAKERPKCAIDTGNRGSAL